MDENSPNQPQNAPSTPQDTVPGGMQNVAPQPQPINPQPPAQPQPQNQPQSQQVDRGSHGGTFSSFWIWALVLFVLNAAAIFWFLVYPTLWPRIVIQDQTIVDRVSIDSVVVSKPAVLVVEMQPQFGAGNLLTTIASTGMLPSGSYTNFDLFIYEGTFAGLESAEVFPPGTVMQAKLFADANSNGIYEPEVDVEPVRNFFGVPVSETFVAI